MFSMNCVKLSPVSIFNFAGMVQQIELKRVL